MAKRNRGQDEVQHSEGSRVGWALQDFRPEFQNNLGFESGHSYFPKEKFAAYEWSTWPRKALHCPLGHLPQGGLGSSAYSWSHSWYVEGLPAPLHATLVLVTARSCNLCNYLSPRKTHSERISNWSNTTQLVTGLGLYALLFVIPMFILQ
jgi:hypothetical protein